MEQTQPSWWRITSAVFVGVTAALLFTEMLDAYIAHVRMENAVWELQQQQKKAALQPQ